MRTKRGDIKRKYYKIFNELAKEMETEVIISDKPIITKFVGYYTLYHNFYFNFKNGITFLVVIKEGDGEILNVNIIFPSDFIKQKITNEMIRTSMFLGTEKVYTRDEYDHMKILSVKDLLSMSKRNIDVKNIVEEESEAEIINEI